MAKRPEAKFTRFERVQKYKGDAQYTGSIVSIYYTIKHKLRYVVDVEPQGFQMIVSETMIRRAPKNGKRT